MSSSRARERRKPGEWWKSKGFRAIKKSDVRPRDSSKKSVPQSSLGGKSILVPRKTNVQHSVQDFLKSEELHENLAIDTIAPIDLSEVASVQVPHLRNSPVNESMVHFNSTLVEPSQKREESTTYMSNLENSGDHTYSDRELRKRKERGKKSRCSGS